MTEISQVYCTIVQTDNLGGDYPNESFVQGLPLIRTEQAARKIADAINEAAGENHPRFWKAVALPYELKPGFEP